MIPFFKLFIFLILAASVIVAGYKTYLYFNEKIIGSRTLPQLLLYALLLISICAGIFILGLWGLLTVYELLTDV